MKLAKNTKVTFVELPGTELHRYYLKKRKDSTPVEIAGVTTMMKRLGLSHGYAFVKPDVLARAAARGTAIHELLQGYEMGEPVNSTIHFEWDCEDGTHKEENEDCSKMLSKYADMTQTMLHYKSVEVEYLVSDNKSVASMIDMVLEVDEHTVDLVDFKSSSTIDHEGLCWQLSIYKYLFERQMKDMQVRNLIGVHCHDVKKLSRMKVTYVGDEAVEDAIKRFNAGDYGENTEGVKSDVPALLTLQEILPDYPRLSEQLALKRDLEATIKKMDAEMSEAIGQLKDKLARENITEVSVPGGRYVFTAEHTSQRFDSKAFMEDEPELYEKYCRQSFIAASLKFYAEK